MKNYFNDEFKFLEYLDAHEQFDRYEEIVDVLFDEETRNLAISHRNVEINCDYVYPDRKNYYAITVSGYSMLYNNKNDATNKIIGIITLVVSIISAFIALAAFALQLFNH